MDSFFALLAFIAIILAGGWAYNHREQRLIDDIAKKTADELEKRQNERK